MTTAASTASAAPRRLLARLSVRRWILDRVRQRRAPTRLPFTLEHRTIFVVPSAFGMGFGVLLVFMALGGLNFNNNMALMLVFVFGSVAQMTTMMAYRNLRGLRVEAIRADPVFAHETAHFQVHLGNPEERERFTLLAGLAGGPANDCIDISTHSSGVLSLACPARQRGWLEMPPFRVETRYPLGMFRAWTWVFPTARCLVYPAPARQPPPLPSVGRGNEGRAQRGEGEQVHGLRKYREGDSLRRVAWRTSARHDELYTREMEIPQDESCILSWDALPGVDAEARLSVLTAWVLKADHRMLSYALELPGRTIPAASGAAHRAACLEAIALHGL